jgi:hypothetical protein
VAAGSHTEALKEFRRCKHAFTLAGAGGSDGAGAGSTGGGPTVTSSKVCVGWYRVEGDKVRPTWVGGGGGREREMCAGWWCASPCGRGCPPSQVRVEVLGAYGILTRWLLTVTSENGGCNNRLRVDSLVRRNRCDLVAPRSPCPLQCPLPLVRPAMPTMRCPPHSSHAERLAHLTCAASRMPQLRGRCACRASQDPPPPRPCLLHVQLLFDYGADHEPTPMRTVEGEEFAFVPVPTLE